jgi:DNA ligase (NAD+)
MNQFKKYLKGIKNMSNSKRIQELENQIKHHNDLYWNQKELEISDIEYDKLVRELEELDPENDLIKSFGSKDVSSDEKLIKHSKPMLSLAKIYGKEELVKWVKKVSRTSKEQFLIQPKYDGMSGLLENGTLSSRGDGIYGQDYTEKLKLIEFDSVNPVDTKNDTLLGEIIIRNSDFKNIYSKIRSKAGIPFKNQRNGIAGILGTDDVDFYYNQGAKITFVDYNSRSWYVTCKDFDKEWDGIIKSIQECVDYPLDGIVIKLDDSAYAESLGYTTHHPRGQVAFKFTNQKAISKLIGIEWGMGKKQISAIGLIEPVEISGTTIKRVKLQLTKPKSTSVETCLIDGSLQIGDDIVVERAGDIIPHILSSTPGENRQLVKIDSCPFCGGKIKITDSSISCMNPDCIEQRIQELYCSIVTLGFKNVGEAYIRSIVNDPSLDVRHISDLFELTTNDLKLQEYGTRKKEIFFEEVAKAKAKATKEQFLASLNFDNVGSTVSKIIVENFKWNDIINNTIDYSKLANLEGIGPIIYKSIESNFKNYNSLMVKYNQSFNFQDEVENFKSENSNGETICFTGKMTYKRSEMEAIAKELGYVPMDHVDKKLSILVCADPNSGSSKLEKAKKNGTKIISEAEFLSLRK